MLQQVYHFKVNVIARDANAAAYKHYKNQEHQDLHDSSVAVMLGEMRREVNMRHPFESKLNIFIFIPTIIHATNDIDCCFMAILSWRKQVGTRIMRKRWSNLTPGWSENLREHTADLPEQTGDKNGKRTEDNSRERRVESQPRAAAQRGYPEDATDTMVAPQDSDVHQSGSVLELQNRDLWLRPTSMSWHFPILVAIRGKVEVQV